ncbi:translocation/assembly module TamB domain-containing protein [Halochromatium roseum]|uniref:translocation/assembly module TamB domain-containing protein n=1 Tax=Halochromatium roseum TaxID=391920 RepID=UPI001913AB77|nr:translocation/assembly module TamB domain-containing protein [Halochromatium roseum]
MASEASDLAGGHAEAQASIQAGAQTKAQAGAEPGTAPAGSKPEQSNQANRRRFRPLRWIGSLIVVTLTLVVLLLVFVFGTQTGLRTLFAVTDDLMPGLLKVERVEGRVLGRLELEGFALNLPGLQASVDALLLDWSPGALFTGTLRVQQLKGSDISLVTEPAAEDKPSEPFELPSVRLPIGVDIDQLLIERLSYRQAGSTAESAIELTRAELSATATGDTVDLRTLTAELSQPVAHARATGQVQLDGAYPISFSLDWRFQQAPALSIAGEGQITGDLDALLISHRISGSVTASLQAQVKQVLKAPSWQAEIDLKAVDLPQLVAEAPPINLQAQLKTQGDLEQASVTGSLSGAAPEVIEMGHLAADLDLAWASQVLTINRLQLTESPTTNTAADSTQAGQASSGDAGLGARVDVTGRLDTSPNVPTFKLEALWERLRWPLAGEPIAQSPQGVVAAEGGLDNYEYRVNLQAFGPQIPETDLALVGTGNQTSTDLLELTLKTLSGLISGKGQLGWSPELAWDLALTAKDLDPGQQWPDLDGRIGLKADTRGGLKEGFSYNLSLDTALSAYPDALVNLTGTGSTTDALIREFSIETLGGVINGNGEATWSPAMHWQFSLEARDLNPGSQYPGLDGRVGLIAKTAGGLEKGFDFSLKGDAALADYPPTRIDLAGVGTSTSAMLERLAIEVIGGRIDGSGEFRWAPAIGWNAALTLADLDPGQALVDWPGRLGGRLQSQGSMAETGIDMSASVSDFGGQLRGYPVALRADVAMQDKAVMVRTLEASSGDTRLSVNGRVEEQLDLRYAFNSPSLVALLPELSGSLKAEGKVAGSLEAPKISLALNGRDIEMSGQGIERVDAKVELGLAPDSALQLNIDGSNLIVGPQRFEVLQVRGQGRTQAHQLSAELKSEPLSLGLTLDAGLGEAGAYRGRLTRLSLLTQDDDDWALQQAAPFSVAAGTVEAGPVCIGNAGSTKGCLAFKQPEAGRFSVSLDLQRLGFDLLDAVTPDTASLTGYLTAKADFQGQGDLLTGTAELRVPEGGVEIVLPRASETLVFTGTRLDVRAGANGIDASFALPVENAGQINAEVGLPGFRLSRVDSQPLTGRIRIDVDSLDRFAKLAPDVSDTAGRIDGDLRLGGRLTQPAIQGNLAVRDLALNVPSIGLEMADLNLTLQSESADAMRLSGGALVGGGQLSIEGNATGIGSPEPNLAVKLKGDQLKVANTKEYMAIVSLDMDAGFGLGGGALRGELSVPTANIMPRTIPAGAVQPSPDVVLEETTQETGLPISIDVLAKLGDQVLVEAFGLRGLLQGQLRVTQQPGKQLLGSGELQVIDGSYRVSLPGLGILTSVGEPLVIEKGIVLFANTPLDNPGIILNAQRQGGDITAGVRVLGTLRNPKLAFFSESDPNMSQSEITSYLVTGIPPKRGGRTDDRSVSVGTYIAPKLYMEYDTSLGEQSDSIKMRYDLTKRIQLQSETGDAQGFDLFYKFEN